MSSRILCAGFTLTSVLVMLSGAPMAGAQGGLCQPGQAGPSGSSGQSARPRQSGSGVSLVILSSSKKVQQLAATIKDAKVLRRDAKTVVFSDGRVVTSDVGSAGRHLNELGWGNRSINVVASFGSRARRPRSFG